MKKSVFVAAHYPFILLLIVLSIWYKFNLLDSLSIYGDEAFSVFHAQANLGELLNTLMSDRNPPLYFILLHFWIKAFGVGVTAVKSLSVLFSIGTAICLYFIGKKHLSMLAGIFASLFFLFSDVHFDISHEVRSHAMVTFLVCLSSFCHFNWLKNPGKLNGVFLGVLNGLLMYTHYITFFFVLGQLLVSLFIHRADKQVIMSLKYYASYGLTFLMLLPWVGVVWSNIPDSGTFWLETPDQKDLFYVLEKLAEDSSLYLWFLCISLISIPLVIVRKKIKLWIEDFEDQKYLVLMVWLVFPLLTSYFVAQFTPIFRLKYVIFCSVAWMLLVGYVISKLNLPLLIRYLLILPFLLFTFKHFHPEDRGIENWPSTAQIIQELQNEHTVVFISAGYKFIDFAYYYNRDWFKDPAQTEQLLKKNDIFPVYTDRDIKDMDLKKYNQVLYVQSHALVVDKQNSIHQYLEGQMKFCKKLGGNKSAAVSTFISKDSLCSKLEWSEPVKANTFSCEYWDTREAISEQDKVMKKEYFFDVEKIEGCTDGWELSKNYAFKGSYSNKVHKDNMYGVTFKKELKKLREIEGVLKVYATEQCNASFVIDIEKDFEKIWRKEIYFSDQFDTYNTWVSIPFAFHLDPEQVQGATLKAYVWNKNSCEVYIDDLTYVLTYEL